VDRKSLYIKRSRSKTSGQFESVRRMGTNQQKQRACENEAKKERGGDKEINYEFTEQSIRVIFQSVW
jgi:hypothetical protein